MFTAKEQEFTDKNTGATVTLGRHEDDASRSWMRITVQHPTQDEGVAGKNTKTTTAFFDGQGEIIKLISHDGTEASGEELDGELSTSTDPPWQPSTPDMRFRDPKDPFVKKR
jgi:hypothetical protein